MRLDLYLTKNFDIQSRNKAHEIIKSNKVKVDGKTVSKPSFLVDETSKIELLEEDFYVSRAAYKLKHFLDEIKISLKNKEALDIGSSTGGFTQILLLNSIKKVTCVDVGSNQLHEKIKNDKRIVFFEKQDIRKFQSDKKFDLVTCDVSFISILNILKEIDSFAKNEIIILFKPQFEVGTNVKRDKKGVVKDKKAVLKAREKFLDQTKLLNWKLKYNSQSKLEGKEGNEEELFYFNK
ncbi:23S rRNA (cytidine-2'-O)-methyltransferase TlyA [Halarcobacter anaerophilus]|uniref:23S rRNA (cytidine-2'-O)-methyltransferase TlyA n=1 Tax=Halarcobacter anaerophilus TaxID=877500 RepID=UPI0005C882A4|nr:TlyA family RNA methyltransferase [Halarcobacter anaerophilus]